MRRGVEDEWGPTGGVFQEDEKDEIVAVWTQIAGGGGRATLSVHGFHHFLKQEIFQGNPISYFFSQ